jgi:hypothetical protein
MSDFTSLKMPLLVGGGVLEALRDLIDDRQVVASITASLTAVGPEVTLLPSRGNRGPRNAAALRNAILIARRLGLRERVEAPLSEIDGAEYAGRAGVWVTWSGRRDGVLVKVSTTVYDDENPASLAQPLPVVLDEPKAIES